MGIVLGLCCVCGVVLGSVVMLCLVIVFVVVGVWFVVGSV